MFRLGSEHAACRREKEKGVLELEGSPAMLESPHAWTPPWRDSYSLFWPPHESRRVR